MYTEVRSTTTAVVDGKLAARLGVASGKEWLIVRGLVRPNSKQLPVCWSDYYIHLDYAAVGRLLPTRHLGPIFVLIEDYYAIRILEIEQQMSASTMSPALAGILKAKPGTTAIELRRTYYTNGGKLVQVSLHTHPAPRFCHSMKMRRIQA
jgi:DNA-binding GntR family transcriptional regulator